jgi:hypothetical protein
MFYAGVSIVVACFLGGFTALLWVLSSAIFTKIAESEFSFSATALYLLLYMLLFLVLAMVTLVAVCFFIYRADIRYRKRARLFTVLRGGVEGERKEPDFSPTSYFAGRLPYYGYFFPGLGFPIMYYGAFGLFPRPQASAPKGPAPGNGGDANIRPFPGAQKNHRKGFGR